MPQLLNVTKPLEDISEEDLRQYWLCCQSEFGWSAASLRISYAGIQHFFSKTLVRNWNIFKQIKWKREQTLPTILSLQVIRLRTSMTQKAQDIGDLKGRKVQDIDDPTQHIYNLIPSK